MITPSAVNAMHAGFPRYEQHEPCIDIRCVTPGEGRCLHRFFDTSPFSPSGRLLAVTRLPFEDRTPEPGDEAQIVVIDLTTGEERVVATTRGWEVQMGANLGWGGDDDTLLFNDAEPGQWKPFARRLTLGSGACRRLGGTIYHASPDGSHIASCNMAQMRRTQLGYGVVVPDEAAGRHVGLTREDGLWITDTQTGAARLVMSIHDAVQAAGPAELRDTPDAFEVYGFHTKWNAAGDRLIMTLRWFPAGAAKGDAFTAPKDGWAVRFAVYTLRPDGSDLRLAVGPERWQHGGHHINFFPDGENLSMNLRLEQGGPLRLVRCGYDGSDLRPITEALLGSGHPTVHPGGMILTDAYNHEPGVSFSDGTVPLRWIDPAAGTETQLARIHTLPPVGPSELRVDPHPAWDRQMRRFAFNACIDGTRRVYVADMSPMLEHA